MNDEIKEAAEKLAKGLYPELGDYCRPMGINDISELIEIGANYANEKCQEEMLDDLIKKKAVIDYCNNNLDYMWASKIVGILLGCDFRDAKEHTSIFYEYCENKGI